MQIYKGPSRLNGEPIKVILTGLGRRSKNAKTGAMIQSYILPDTVHPYTAITTGADESVCGDCPLRPSAAAPDKPRCYVRVAHGPSSTWKANRTAVTERAPNLDRPLRIGTYGDPAAVPTSAWKALTKHVRRWTGYTHQWRRRPSLRPYVMASVGSESEARLAWSKGWRTFRVKQPDDALLPGEITCPASKEAGHRTTCDACGLCNGARENDRRANIAINAH